MALSRPVARVLPLLPLPHLDREFDYLVPDELDSAAQPGVRVRVRFAGRLVDGFVLARTESSDHPGKLGKLDRVVSPERVLTPEITALAETVAARYAGTRADVLRLAIPPRHARVEGEEPKSTESALDPVGPIDPFARWADYTHGDAFGRALHEGRAPRAGWQALPGEDWPARLAELAAVTAATGAGALLLVPDQRDLDRLHAACEALLGADRVVGLAAGLGPAARYRRWLAVLRGSARVVVGTRSAVFAPVAQLGLIAIWDDGDDTYAEPRSPYPHAREVALLRTHATGCAFVAGGFARTAETQALVESGWARDLVAPRALVRARAPRIVVPGDTDVALERDPGARAARLPAVAFAAARSALAADLPVLVQVPRRGYIPTLACAKCRTAARCRTCNGPMQLPSGAGDEPASPSCRWCARVDAAYRCAACGSRALRAQVVGASRTAEELGRAFAGAIVVSSGGNEVLDEVAPGARLVVATVGAEPLVTGGYGAALLLDAWALLGRADLRAAEEALRRWMTAAALVRPAEAGGQVIVVADPANTTVQSLVRWDPVGHAASQLADRSAVRFPPAARIAAVDGPLSAVEDLVASADLPDGVEVLGPVPLPDSAAERSNLTTAERSNLTTAERSNLTTAERLLLRVPKSAGLTLSRSLAAAQAARSARKADSPVRVQIDPIDLG